MNSPATKKDVYVLSLLFAVTYMISYITRINYGAIISAMEETTAFTRSELSLAVTGSFVTYGVGQIISGIVGDKVSPKKLISYGLAVSVIMNLLIPICKNPYQMLAVWCVNGFAQSFMWPPMVRLMSTLLSERDYKEVSNRVSWGSSVGTIVVYLTSPLIISLFDWRGVFFFSALCGAIMILLWNKFACDVPKKEKAKKQEENTVSKSNTLFTPVMFFVMAAIALQGMLRDGVTTWMPSYISETYNLSHIISILTGVILPVFSIFCFNIATRLYIKKFTNPLLCAGLFFGCGTVAAVGLFLLTGFNAAFSVMLSAILTGCMHGVNLILICMIPPFFKKHGNISTVSGVLNSCTYVGSALSTYGIALLSEKFGWSFTLLSWVSVAAAGTAVCLICAKPWERRFGKN